MTSPRSFDLSVDSFESDVRAVFLPVGRLSEQICIAMIGWSEAIGPWARAATPKALPSLPNDLGHALFTFGSLVIADYDDWCRRGEAPQGWTPPIAGLILGDWFTVEGFDAEDALRVAMSLSALCPGQVSSAKDDQPSNPRSSDERRFLDAVRLEIARARPGLAKGFRRGLSLTGKAVGGEIDFVGHHYVTCYAAVNPRGRAASRVQTASAALWRLARARDAFGFAAPAIVELTAWVPPEGLPIYSEQEYRTASETVAELREQASKEELTVFSVTDVPSACRRLIEIEVSSAPVLS